MPEARDRLSREDDIVATYNRRRNSNTSNRSSGRGDSPIFVLQVDADERQLAETPFRWRGTAMMGTMAEASGGGGVLGRGIFGSPRTGREGYFSRSPASVFGGENLSPMISRGRGGYRGRGRSVLPAWYPRKPLRDITAVARAIERRRACWGEGEGLLTESPILRDQTVHDPFVSASGAQLEHGISMASPHTTIGNKHWPPTIGKVPKILLDITRQSVEETACLTPQRKLLNSIDNVEKVVMDEFRKLKRTPTAKKVEREKRVRTLMSMR
ncbi:protein POLYCHOME-like [Primulina huaijiensis]|uniref:protein POLYCHOME-like n=1 Tax=Primulina huaijiensis TaxID=1492673 RepID=UPI003CC71F6A